MQVPLLLLLTLQQQKRVGERERESGDKGNAPSSLPSPFQHTLSLTHRATKNRRRLTAGDGRRTDNGGDGFSTSLSGKKKILLCLYRPIKGFLHSLLLCAKQFHGKERE